MPHALFTPPTTPSGGRGAPSYGELTHVAFGEVEHACRDGSGPFTSADAAAGAVTGYERFLAVCGRHLRLLAAPGLTDLTGHRGPLPPLAELIARMTALDLIRGGDSAWSRAADALALAHDLLATHLGPAGEQRTPDADILGDPRLRQAATARLLAAVTPAVRQCGPLLASAARAPADSPGTVMTPVETKSTSAHLRQATQAIDQLITTLPTGTTSKTIGTGRGASDDEALAPLDALAPALPRTTVSAGGPRSQSFDDAVAALRVLRLLSYRQTTGHENTSPASLHDLTRLAITTTHHAEAWLPTPATPLARVQRAAALDRLQEATRAWQKAASRLSPNIQGLTKAPRVYADAIHVVLAQAPHNKGLGRAVLAALPRLGNDAALTLTRLTNRGDLAAATKASGGNRATWRPLEPSQGAALTHSFAAAGQASQQAHATVLQVDRSPTTGTRGDNTTLRRGRSARRELSLGTGLR